MCTDITISCTRLKQLELSWLGLEDVPHFVKFLTSLTHLSLEGNNITSLPGYIGLIPNIAEVMVIDLCCVARARVCVCVCVC